MTRKCPHCEHVGELEPDGDYPAGSYRWVCTKCGKTPYSRPVESRVEEVQMSEPIKSNEPIITYDELTIPGKLYISRDTVGIVRQETGRDDVVAVCQKHGDETRRISGEEEVDAIWKWLEMRTA